jgi:hypothetical protein
MKPRLQVQTLTQHKLIRERRKTKLSRGPISSRGSAHSAAVRIPFSCRTLISLIGSS